MPELKRITPEEVLKAITENNLTPMQRAYASLMNGRECTCGLSSLVISEEITFDFVNASDSAEDFVFGIMKEDGFVHDYLVGFTLGFDGRIKSGLTDDGLLGIRDGKDAWEAVKHLAVTE